MARSDGRADDELRPEISITRGFQKHPAGSVLVEFGRHEGAVRGERHRGRAALAQGHRARLAHRRVRDAARRPRNTRSDRESVKGRVGGRTHEISRLIGRSLRACIDLRALGENTIALDCDVLQADGGTRTAAITGAYVALADAVTWLGAHGRLADPKPLSCQVAAVSVGRRRRPGAPGPALRGGLARRGRHERRRHRHRHARSRCRAPARAPRSPAPRSTRCSTRRSPASARLTELQVAALAAPYPGELP